MAAVEGQRLFAGAERPDAAMAVRVADIKRIVGGNAPRPPVGLPTSVGHAVKRPLGFLLVEHAHPDTPTRLVQLLGEQVPLAVEAVEEETALGIPEFGPQRSAGFFGTAV